VSPRSVLRPRGSPLEYWFVKLAYGDLAFLADWIVRRRDGTAEVRVSLWVRGAGRVLHQPSPSWAVGPDGVEVAGCRLTGARATGSVGDVAWDLGYDSGPTVLDPVPRPARLLRPFDLQIEGRPRARFTGSVTVGGETFQVPDVLGGVTHYWGRRLPDAWLWVSADGIGPANAVVEASLIRTRLWGRSQRGVVGGYVLVDDGERREQVVAPGYGVVHAADEDGSFVVTARSARHRLRLTASAPAQAYNDLGEGIRQTLLGTVTVDGWGSAHGTAGVEVRSELP
jgi:hypothetical protein